tara:strand:+ start:1276 stop:2031 length:756 start_codon:yes stop_codon:yes gene_type:complete
MSLTTDEKVHGFVPIATFGKKIAGVVDNPMLKDGSTKIETNEKVPFRQAVNKDTERSILYVTAPSGSGKSYYTRQYIEDYHKAYPKRHVYVFSALDSCATLDKLKYLKRIKIKEAKFLNMELNAIDFKESLCVFDDTDVISNKHIKLKVFTLLNSILETGRHSKVSCVFTSHNANMGLDTKRILNEAHSITIFPRNMGNRQLKYLLGEYLGFDKDEIKRIKKTNGRWVTICKSYPMTFFDQSTMFIKDMDD